MVKQGDILARIDPRSYQAALDQAVAKKAQDEAQLANAGSTCSATPPWRGTRASRSSSRTPSAPRSRSSRRRSPPTRARSTRRGPSFPSPPSARRSTGGSGCGWSTRATSSAPATRPASSPSPSCSPSRWSSPCRSRSSAGCRRRWGAARCRSRSARAAACAAAGGRAADHRQRGRCADRHDQAEGLLRQRGSAALARRLRQCPAGGGPAEGVTTVPLVAVQRGPEGAFAFVVKPDRTVEQRPLPARRADRDRSGGARRASSPASGW